MIPLEKQQREIARLHFWQGVFQTIAVIGIGLAAGALFAWGYIAENAWLFCR